MKMLGAGGNSAAGTADAGATTTGEFKNAGKIFEYQSTGHDLRSLALHAVYMVSFRPRCIVNFARGVPHAEALAQQRARLEADKSERLLLSSTTRFPHNNPAKWLPEGMQVIVGASVTTSGARAPARAQRLG